MRFVFLVVLITLCGALKGQVLHSAKVEVVGKPTWYEVVSLENEGVILVLKEDQTKFKILKLDSNLTKRWEQDFFLDTDKRPSAISKTEDRLILLFAETSGMFYQLLDFDVSTGEFKRYGFEVLDFFQEQQVFINGSKIILVGSNSSGLAYFIYDLETELGKLVETKLKGKITVEHAELTSDGHVELLASVQTLGYANESKKKGAYIKTSEIFFGKIDFLGNILETQVVEQEGGKFPMTARLGLSHRNISGVYQATDGSKGLYFATFSKLRNKPTLSIPFTEIFQGGDYKRLYKEFYFFSAAPVKSNDFIYSVVFMFSNDTRSGNSSDKTLRQTAVVASNGIGKNVYSVVLTEAFSERLPTLAVSPQGNVAYISNGKLLVKNLEAKNMPLAYKLSDEEKNYSEPQYRQVIHWYSNLFLGIGTQSKEEVTKLNFNEKASKAKKKKKRMETFTQTRKTYFVTAIKAN